MKTTYIFNNIVLFFIGIGLVTACGKSTKSGAGHKQQVNIPIDTTLKSRLEKFGGQRRPNGNFGFHVYDLTADKPVYGVNEHQAQPSASCLKLLTGIAGLNLLGTQYTYKTSIYIKGNIEGGTLHGDVTLKAGLDPQIMAPDLDMFAKALKRKGIRKIDGTCYLDLTITEPVKSEEHWYPWDLSFSKYGIFFKGEERIRKAWKNSLRKTGIQISEKQMAAGSIPKGSHCIFRFYRSVDRITKLMWKHSSNTKSTALLYAIGKKVDPKAEPTKAGVRYLRSFMKDTLGLKDTTLVIHDGCGLCTHNHLSPIALTTILRYGYKHKPIYNLLLDQLSIAGVDGTMRREMVNSKARNKIFAKTGTLSHPYGISSLAGYCRGSNGHVLAFAIMDSKMSVLDARVLQKKLCEALIK